MLVVPSCVRFTPCRSCFGHSRPGACRAVGPWDDELDADSDDVTPSDDELPDDPLENWEDDAFDEDEAEPEPGDFWLDPEESDRDDV